MKVLVEELKADGGRESFLRIELEDLGVKDLPDHVLAAAGNEAGIVIDNFRRAGTACGHVQHAETQRCNVMVCSQYVGLHGGR